METRYCRNRLYLTKEEQNTIKKYPILLVGAGIGSVVAECALRFGFENITIVDGDKVELSNLNRQNYTQDDISISKVEALVKRLKAINKNAKITYRNDYLSSNNMEEYIYGYKVSINTMDFSSDIPLEFDKVCQKHNIPVLHPYNVGWSGLVAVIMPKGLSLESITKSNKKINEVSFVEYASSYLQYWGDPNEKINEIIAKYKKEKENLPPPQLSIGSWIVAGMCTSILFDIATNKRVKKIPEFYMCSTN